MHGPSFPRPWGRTAARSAALALAFGIAGAAPAAERGFPYDRELFLESGPIGKSRKIPSLEVKADGRATIDLYCASGDGQVTVSGEAIAIVPGPMVEPQCPPERLRGDDELMAALSAATSWRREGDALVLMGTRTLRYRPATD